MSSSSRRRTASLYLSAWPNSVNQSTSLRIYFGSELTNQQTNKPTKQVTKAGGCNCSRANLAGACLGALYGFDCLQTPPPTEGVEETSDTMGSDGAFIHGGAKGTSAASCKSLSS